MAIYELKYMFDWGSGTCVWTSNEASRNLFVHYPVRIEQLPISKVLKDELKQLIEEHDKALDWDCPSNGFVWSEERQKQFISEAIFAYKRLCLELGMEYHVEMNDNWLL
ncbi:MAG: hypothetical protein Q4D37_07485 [Oscillospiraceae bacterium]|nr:hypothetical protein [Oscillospiraceae bacterium]